MTFYKSYNFEYQQSCSGQHLCHTTRHIWDGNPQKGEGSIIASIHRSYKLTRASYSRLARLASYLSDRNKGQITFWANSPHSWFYMPNLVQYTEASDRWIRRFKAGFYHEVLEVECE